MQDFVGVRVADAADQPWIGQCAFQRVIAAFQRGLELRGVEAIELDTAGLMRGEPCSPAHDVQRRALLRPGFGQD
jgi:hypothetical protein